MEIVQEEGLHQARATISLNAALCLLELGRYRAAERYFGVARRQFELDADLASVAEADLNEGYLEVRRGRYRVALGLFDSAEAGFLSLELAYLCGHIELDRAELFLRLGLLERARHCAAAALRKLGDERESKEGARAELFAGMAWLLAQRPKSAVEPLAHARAAFEKLGNRVLRAECDLLLARCARGMNQSGLAERLARRAAKDWSEEAQPARVAAALTLSAWLEHDRGKCAEALGTVARAQRMLERHHAPWVEMELARIRGLALLETGDRVAGTASLQRALELLETQRAEVPADQFMVGFLASRAQLHEETVSALVHDGRTREAFDVSERARSRALVDMLAARGSGPVRPRGQRPLMRAGRLGSLRAQLAAAYRRLQEPGRSAAATAELRRQTRDLERDLSERLQDELRRDPEFGSLHVVGCVELRAVQDALDPETTLLEYFVTATETFAFVVTTDSVRCVRLGARHREISDCVRRFHRHVTVFYRPDGDKRHLRLTLDGATTHNLRRLHELLIEPVVAAGCLSARRLVVVAHGPLHAVPFHALHDGGDWLCERFEIAYAPSAAVYAQCRNKPPAADGPPCILAVASADAPLIEREASVVADALGAGSVRFHDGEATLDRLRELAPVSRVLHIASHATFRPDRPDLSQLHLGDGKLDLYDAYDLDVRADLVTLSACETGVAKVSGGDDLLGLVRGFLYAGAPRLLLSHWRVNDASTAELMGAFYRASVKGASYSAALQSAMAAVRAEHPHPYYWAGFFLVGFPGQGTRNGVSGRGGEDAVFGTSSGVDSHDPPFPDPPELSRSPPGSAAHDRDESVSGSRLTPGGSLTNLSVRCRADRSRRTAADRLGAEAGRNLD